MDKIYGCPPADYSGSILNWKIQLELRGLWNGVGWYGNVRLTKEEYMSVLKTCNEQYNKGVNQRKYAMNI